MPRGPRWRGRPPPAVATKQSLNKAEGLRSLGNSNRIEISFRRDPCMTRKIHSFALIRFRSGEFEHCGRCLGVEISRDSGPSGS